MHREEVAINAGGGIELPQISFADITAAMQEGRRLFSSLVNDALKVNQNLFGNNNINKLPRISPPIAFIEDATKGCSFYRFRMACNK